MSELVYRLLQTQPFPLGRVAAKSLLNVLAWRCHDDDLYAFPSVARLAREVGTTEGHVRKQLRWLREDGWLAVKNRRRRNGTMTSSAYTFPWLPAELVAPPIPQDRRDSGSGGQNGAHPLSKPGSPPIQTGVASYPPGYPPKTLLENTSGKHRPPLAALEALEENDLAALTHDGAAEAPAAVSAAAPDGAAVPTPAAAALNGELAALADGMATGPRGAPREPTPAETEAKKQAARDYLRQRYGAAAVKPLEGEHGLVTRDLWASAVAGAGAPPADTAEGGTG